MTVIENEKNDHVANVERMQNEINLACCKTIKEKIDKLQNIEKEETDNIEKQKLQLNLDKHELECRRKDFDKETRDFHKSVESLGRRKSYMFSIGSLKFGRQ